MEGKGGEIRRVHVIYFLSRMGRIEHPHLIRINHLNRAGVHLKDVKRWLSDLRGKEMPDSFSWSYKRRYKTGYVWQDLMDDDLITPISDNEYVLKGSEMSTFPFEMNVAAEKTDPIQKPAPVEDKTVECNGDKDADFKPPAVTEPEKEELVKRTLSFKLEEERKKEEEEEEEEVKFLESKGSFSDTYLTEKKEIEDEGLEKTKKKKDEKSNERKSTSSHVFRNILTCGAVDTKDSAVRPIYRRSKAAGVAEKGGEISMTEGLGGSQRVFGGSWNQRKQQMPQNGRKSFDGTNKSSKKNSTGNTKPVSAASKPVPEPNCSQCGKAFKPEKLHSHMKSCRSLKSRVGKGGPAAAQKLPRAASKDVELRTTTATKGSTGAGLVVRAHSLQHK